MCGKPYAVYESHTNTVQYILAESTEHLIEVIHEVLAPLSKEQ